jgi:parvulin-like peptidyl-prolyl isomerase
MRGTFIRTAVREPLLQFVVLGAIVFGLYQALGGGNGVDAGGTTIVVDRARLLDFMQNRAQRFNEAQASAVLEALSSEERSALIREFARDEILYREAKVAGLDQNDYSIRRRLVQHMEYLYRGDVAQVNVRDEELAAYLKRYPDRYREPARATFSHVFVRVDGATSDVQARERAARLLAVLNRKRVPFHEAPAYGDRFLYQVNYVDRTAEEIEPEFGADARAALFSLTPDDSRWQGPIRSSHGFHLVMLTQLGRERVPSLEEVRRRVERDLLREREEAAVEQSISALASSYRLQIDPAFGVAAKRFVELPPAPTPAP